MKTIKSILPTISVMMAGGAFASIFITHSDRWIWYVSIGLVCIIWSLLIKAK